jgi:hypothetical protein
MRELAKSCEDRRSTTEKRKGAEHDGRGRAMGTSGNPNRRRRRGWLRLRPGDENADGRGCAEGKDGRPISQFCSTMYDSSNFTFTFSMRSTGLKVPGEAVQVQTPTSDVKLIPFVGHLLWLLP